MNKTSGEAFVNEERAATEAEWKKSKRIDEERMKAARALNEAKPDINGVAALGPQQDKPRGWSSDSRLITEKAEKLGMWAAVLAPAGVVLMIISDVGSVVTEVGKLGLFGVLFSILGGLGLICFAVVIFFGLIGFVTAVYYRGKLGKKLGVAGWSGMGAIMIVVVYFLIRSLLLRM